MSVPVTAAGQVRDSAPDDLVHRKPEATRGPEAEMTTSLRTTCDSCQLTFDVPSAAIVLALPAPTADAAVEPSFVHICPSCLACDSMTVPWRTAAYLLDAGATAITAPDLDQIQPRYPERRPDSTLPMSLDDLIDLHAALDSDARAF
jgi:hypothetical protein